MKLLYVILSMTISLFLFSIPALAQIQSHPLSQLYPMDVNLNVTGVNVTNVSYIFFGNNSVDTYLYRSGTNTLQTASHLVVTGGWVNSTGLNVSGTTNVSINSPTFFIDATNKRVGIGTVTPDQALTISGGNLHIDQGNFWSAGATNGVRVSTSTGNNFWVNAPSDTLMSIGGIGSTPPSSGRINIDSSGRVGIGIANPQGLLHVSGSQVLFNNTPSIDTNPWFSLAVAGYSASSGTVRFEDMRNDQSSPSFVWNVYNNGNTIPAYNFSTGNTSRLVITQTGNVGIGTTSPSTLLDVRGGINASQINITGTGTLLNVSNRTHSQLYVNDTGIGYVIIPQGNVGIGTTNPLAKLHILNDSSGTVMIVRGGNLDDTDIAGIELQSNGGSPQLARIIAQQAVGGGGKNLQFQTATGGAFTTRMTIVQSSGNVGIGTASPGTKLDVVGQINASRITVNNSDVITIANASSGSIGLVGYWTFDEGAGTTAKDNSGYGNDGTLSNLTDATCFTNNACPAWTLGRYGYALDFDRIGDRVQMGVPAIFNFSTGDLSLSAWFSANQTPSAYMSIATKGASGNVGYGLFVDSSNKIDAAIQATGGTNQHCSGSTLTAGRWYHAVAVYGRSDVIRVYLNGVLDTTCSYSAGNTGNVGGTDQFRVGMGPSNLSPFNGTIDEVKLWNRTLSVAEVQSEYLIGASKHEVDMSVRGLVAGTWVNATNVNISNILYGPNFVAASGWGNFSNLNVTNNATIGGYVGIGTTTPQALLNPVVASGSTVAFNVSNAGTGNSLVVEDSVADTSPFMIASDGNVTIGSTDPSNTKLAISLSDSSTYSSSNVAPIGAVNGISIDNSASLSGGYSGIRFRAGGNGQMQGFIGIVDEDGSSADVGRLVLGVRNNGANIVERMAIDELGRVGIGTTNPTETLSVVGSANISTWLNASALNISGTNNVSINSPTFFIDTTNSRVGIGTTSPATLLHVNSSSATELRITAGNTNTALLRLGSQASPAIAYVNYDASADSLYFSARNTRGADMTINGSTGNVGIGTTSPGANLNITNAASSSNTFLLDVVNASEVGHYLVVRNSGYVGINMTSPNMPLQVMGPGALWSTTGVANIFTIGRSETGSNWGQAVTFAVGKHRNGGLGNEPFTRLDILLKNVSNSNAYGDVTVMTMESEAGNVGIGTTDPSSTLSVQARGATSTILSLLSTGGSEVFTVLNGSGNVGIGTTTPNSLLHVLGNATINGSLYVNDTIYQYGYGSDDGLLLYLPFSEGTGGTAYDRGPYGNDGVLVNTNTTGNATSGWKKTGCEAGWCMQLDGTNAYINISDSNLWALGNNFTISMWISPNSFTKSSVNALITQHKNDNDNWKLYYDNQSSENNLYFAVNNSQMVNATFGFENNTWYNVVVTSSNGAGDIYINSLNRTTNRNGTNTAVHNVQNTGIQIGSSQEGGPSGGYFLNASIDEVRIYNRTLSLAEIRTQYLQGFQSQGVIKADVFRIVNTTGNTTFIVNGTNVGIGTTAPTEKLMIAGNITPTANNTYDLGNNTLRWREIYGVRIFSGDIILENKFKITETADGIEFRNPNGKAIMRLDSEGNLWIKGEVRRFGGE